MVTVMFGQEWLQYGVLLCLVEILFKHVSIPKAKKTIDLLRSHLVFVFFYKIKILLKR